MTYTQGASSLIDYIYSKTSLEAYMIEWLPNNHNKKTTQDSTYIKENMLEINDIVE